MGSISWAEHYVADAGGTAWQDSWQLSDPYGIGVDLIPPTTSTVAPDRFALSGTTFRLDAAGCRPLSTYSSAPLPHTKSGPAGSLRISSATNSSPP